MIKITKVYTPGYLCCRNYIRMMKKVQPSVLEHTPPSSAPSFTWLYTIQECENQKLVLRNRFHSSKAQLNNLILLSNSYFILSHDHVTKFYTPCYLCCRNHINGLESLFQNMQNMHLWLYFQRRNLAKLIWI